MDSRITKSVEKILKDNPLKSNKELFIEYFELDSSAHEGILTMLSTADSITRAARKYRQKIGVRDEARQAAAESERKQQSQTPMLEPNPPENVTIYESKTNPGVKYEVRLLDDGRQVCNCPGFEHRDMCKHIENSFDPKDLPF